MPEPIIAGKSREKTTGILGNKGAAAPSE